MKEERIRMIKEPRLDIIDIRGAEHSELRRKKIGKEGSQNKKKNK